MSKVAEKIEEAKTKIEVEETTNTKSMTKKGVSIKGQRTFETDLLGKEEIFKLLSLAEALQLGILLVGPPGTGKTKIVTDYTKGMFDLNDPEQVRHLNDEGVFMLETDEGTKSSE